MSSSESPIPALERKKMGRQEEREKEGKARKKEQEKEVRGEVLLNATHDPKAILGRGQHSGW